MTDAEIVKVYGIEHLMDRQLDLSVMQMLEKMIEEDTELTEEQARFFDRMLERSQQKLKEFEAVVRERCEKGALVCWSLAKSEGFKLVQRREFTVVDGHKSKRRLEKVVRNNCCISVLACDGAAEGHDKIILPVVEGCLDGLLLNSAEGHRISCLFGGDTPCRNKRSCRICGAAALCNRCGWLPCGAGSCAPPWVRPARPCRS